MSDKEIEVLRTYHLRDENPPRALMWAWYNMPKSFRNTEGELEQAKASHRFLFLRRNRDEYFKFLKDHDLKKTVYDKFIGVHEKEPKTTW